MLIFSSLLCALAVFVIAALSVGGATTKLAGLPPQLVYDPDMAVTWVSGRASDLLTSQLSYADVAVVLREHLSLLEADQLTGIDSNQLVSDLKSRCDQVLAKSGVPSEDLVDERFVAELIGLHVEYLQKIGVIAPS